MNTLATGLACGMAVAAPGKGGSGMRTSDYAVFLAALLALATSIYLWFGGQRDEGLFVGLWVPSILAFATYIRISAARK
jgi:hypothetical protein